MTRPLRGVVWLVDTGVTQSNRFEVESLARVVKGEQYNVLGFDDDSRSGSEIDTVSKG